MTGVPGAIEVLSSAATIGLILSVGYFVWRLFLLVKRRLLWRVRRKLILSYIFIGVVPALLIIAFFILGAWVVSMNVSAYLFRDGYDDMVDYAGLAANAAAARSRGIRRRRRDDGAGPAGGEHRRPAIPPAVDGLRPDRGGGAAAGAGRRLEPRAAARPHPAVADAPRGATDSSARSRRRHRIAAATSQLIARAAVPVQRRTRRLGFVVVDIPIDGQILDSLHEATGVKAGSIELGGDSSARAAVGDRHRRRRRRQSSSRCSAAA